MAHLDRIARRGNWHNRRQAFLRPCVERLEARLPLAAVFYDSFENGLLNNWTIPDLGTEARVVIRDLYAEGIITNAVSQQFGLRGNERSLAFDSTRASEDNNKDLGIAILAVDLSGMTDGLLTFHHFEGADDNDVLPDQHMTNSPGDGLSVSRDGATWYRMLNVDGFDINRSGDGLWQLHEYDLGLEFARINTAFSAGLQFDANIQFKFSQFDDRPLFTNGWAIDEVTIQDEAATFSLDRPKGAFHRFNLAGEDDDDYYFRAAVYGNVDANTPIMVAVHGSNGDTNIDGYSWRWHQFVADPANGIGAMIVITPAFVENVAPGRFNTPVRYPLLSWNTTDDAAADLALLETVDTITQTGIGDGSGIYLWGFSAGGQFVGRFTAAHPDRVAAAVVGGPSSQILPTEFVTYHLGLGANNSYPPPVGVSLDQNDFLSSRIMYWVGQDDNDPNHSQLEQNPSIDSTQGTSRRERSIYQFEQMHLAAQQRGIDPRDYEYELLISEGDGHGWSSSDIPEIHEFLFRDRTAAALPIQVLPRIVVEESLHDRQTYLPQNVDRILPGQDFFVELWIEAPAGGTTGVESGELELFFDTNLADVIGMEHGLYSTAVSGVLDEAAGRIRDFGGSTPLVAVGVDEYALFGRVAMRADGAGLSEASRLAIALQRDEAQDFMLDGGLSQRTDLMPFTTTLIGASAQNVADSLVQGVVFHDTNGDGIRQATEAALPNREVKLTDAVTGELVKAAFHVEPDESLGHGAYLHDAHAWVALSAVGTEVINPGVRAYELGADESSTGVNVFAHRTAGGFFTQWLEGLRTLRMDFTAPTSSVSIDITAKLNDARDYGKLEVYSEFGTLLETKQSSNLADGAFETVTITRQQSDIAYAVAYGAGGNNVRLDNLRFTSGVRADTDADGAYVFDQLPPGNYKAILTDIPGWGTTVPSSGEHALNLAAGDVAANRDFGSLQLSLTLAIDAAEISELGGTTTATVARVADTSLPLTVTLSSSDTSEATVPSTVTIPANQTSATFSITAVDDSLLDGTQTVTITASAGTVTGTDTVDVTDHETLSLSIADASISESGGSAAATVMRGNTDISQPLTVSLSSSDTSEAAVPSTVTIPANQASAPFTVTAVDDNIADGTQTVTITASATGYIDGTETVDVTDHETLALSLTLSIVFDAISEHGGSTSATVTRGDTDVSQPLIVALSNSDTSEAAVPSAVTIPANQVSATFSVIAVDDSLLDGTQTVTISALATGYDAGTDTVNVIDYETLTLSIDAASISESGGSATATLTRSNTDRGAALTVLVASDDTSEVVVPASVTIPAGQASTTFQITAVDDDVLDGSQTVMISATNVAYVAGTATLLVLDHEGLAVSIDAGAISEHGGMATGTVTRLPATSGSPITVLLTSSDTSGATVPVSIQMGATETTATFTIAAVDDSLLDGPQTVTITAEASGLGAGVASIDILDYETLTVAIAADSISELGDTATATVTRGNTDDLSQSLTVALSSDDASEASVPALVVIPANIAAVDFTVTSSDDDLLDGTQSVTITAAAGGYVSVVDSIDVTDFEALTLTTSDASISENGGSTTATVSRSNTGDLSQDLVVALAHDDTSEIVLPATATIPANQASVVFNVAAIDDDILDGTQTVNLSATAAGYVTGDQSLNVLDFETLTVVLDTASISEDGGTATATVTRSDLDGLSQPLTISLASSDFSEATVPETIMIPGNQASTTFTITAQDDLLLDGNQQVAITAVKAGYIGVGGSLEVTDSETLSVLLDAASISENSGAATGTVTRGDTDDLSRALTVNLFSNDPSEATVPATVAIPANQASATFAISAVDDALLDGIQTVTITSSASGYISSSSSLDVTDHETLSLELSAAEIFETGGQATVTVRRNNSDIGDSLVVSLTSSDTSEVTFPETATIPAGESSTSVLIAARPEDEPDGTQTVLIAATAIGYVGDEVSLDVTDNPFPWHNMLLSQDVNDDGAVSPVDALIIVNDLNSKGPRPLNTPVGASFLDVSRDGSVSPLDALLVVNFLNSRFVSEEGEANAWIAALSRRVPVSNHPVFPRDAPARVTTGSDLSRTSQSIDQPARPTASIVAPWDVAARKAELDETLEAFVEDIATFWNTS